MTNSIGLHLMIQSSMSISQAAGSPLPLIHLISQSQAIKHHGLVIFGHAVQETISADEIMGMGVINADNHKCMTLGFIQTLDCKVLENMDKNLVDWYSNYLISRKDRLQKISNIVVADAFFSKKRS